MASGKKAQIRAFFEAGPQKAEVAPGNSTALPKNQQGTDQLSRFPGIWWPRERLDKRNARLYASRVDDKFYGRALRWWREKVGMKQAHLARTARIPPNTLSALENKGQGMKDDLFIQLCWFIGADPQIVADHAYFKFRRHLGERARRLAADLPTKGDDGGSAVPSLEEVMRLHDAASAAWRSYRLATMRFMRPDIAVSAFLEDLFQDLEPEPPEGDPKEKRRPRRKP